MNIAKSYQKISFRVVRWREVDVFIDLTTLLLIWIYFDRTDGGWAGQNKYVVGILVGGLVIVSILIHELAHAWVGLLCGALVDKIYLNVLGGVCVFRSELPSHWRNFLISAAGPLSNIALYFLFTQASRQGMQHYDYSVWSVVFDDIAQINLVLGLLNLLPAYPLDGGHVLRHFAALVTRREIIGAWLVTITGVIVAGGLVFLSFLALKRLNGFNIIVLIFFVLLILAATYAQLHLARQELRKKKVGLKAPSPTVSAAGAPRVIEIAQNRLCQPFESEGQFDFTQIYKKPEGRAAIRSWYESKLNNLRVPFESIMVATRFGPTHLLAFGPKDGPAVVMLDGPNSDALNWKRLMPVLANHFRIFAVDIIGQPNLSAPVRLPAKGTDYGWWLADILDGLGLEKAHMVGEMGGCWPIFQLAAMQPERLQSTTLITPFGLIPQHLHNVRLITVLYELLATVLPTQANMIRYYRRINTANAKKPQAQVEESIATIKLRRHYYIYNSQIYSEIFTADELAKLTKPTLLVVGNETVLYQPEKMVEQARKVFPGLWSAEIVPECGASVTHDRPEWLAQRLASFWMEILQITPSKEWHLTAHKQI